MPIDFNQIKAKTAADYDTRYYQNAAMTYGNLGGRINWDDVSGKASFQGSSTDLPSLTQMWSNYSKGARSRGITPNFMTFKNFYDNIKATQRMNIVSSLSGAQTSGVPIDKIHDAIRENPAVKNALIKTINSSQDPNVKASLSAFVPTQEMSLERAFDEHKTLLATAGVAGLGGLQYGFSKDYAALDESKKILADAKKLSPKKSEFQTKKGRWKKGGKKDFDAAMKDHKAGLKDFRKDVKLADQSRFRKLGTKWFGKAAPGTGLSSVTAGAGLFLAPTIVEGISKNILGLKKSDANKVGNITSTVIAAGYSAKTAYDAAKVVSKLPKGVTSAKLGKALSKFGIYGKLASAAFLIWSAAQRYKD